MPDWERGGAASDDWCGPGVAQCDVRPTHLKPTPADFRRPHPTFLTVSFIACLVEIK